MVATVVGIAVGVVLGYTALVSGLCATWGEECSTEENAHIARLWKMAFAAPFVVVGLYTAVDLLLSAALRDRPPSSSPQRPGQHTAGFAKADQRGPVDGRVVAWHDETGWGVLASPELAGDVFAHESNVPNSIRRPLPVGLAVRFSYESPGPEGYLYQAIWVTPSRG